MPDFFGAYGLLTQRNLSTDQLTTFAILELTDAVFELGPNGKTAHGIGSVTATNLVTGLPVAVALDLTFVFDREVQEPFIIGGPPFSGPVHATNMFGRYFGSITVDESEWLRDDGTTDYRYAQTDRLRWALTPRVEDPHS